MTGDRQVHAISGDLRNLVRFNRSGKWYIEVGSVRHMVSISEAVRIAIEWDSDRGRIFLGRPGGRAFDAKVRKALTA